MTHVLGVLKAIGDNEPYYGFLTDSQRARAAEALEAGIRCVLKIQIEREEKK